MTPDTPRRMMSQPLSTPHSIPTAQPMSTAITGDHPIASIAPPVMIPTSPPMAPTDRFIPPVPMMTICAMPTIATMENERARATKLTSEKKSWVVRPNRMHSTTMTPKTLPALELSRLPTVQRGASHAVFFAATAVSVVVCIVSDDLVSCLICVFLS